MGVKLTRQCLDAGLVTCNEAAAVRFYSDVLGLTQAGEVSIAGVGVIKRYQVGDSILRILVAAQEPPLKGSTDGFLSQTGLRYITLTIANLDDTIAAVKASEFKVSIDIMALRPGTRTAMVEDADGNTIELMEVEQ
jgi:predicted enzyme related to lactoylglutathione lyase